MTSTEHRLFIRTMIVGLSLTALVIALQHFGRLDGLENAVYDFRTRHFQFFTQPPTDRIVHLDIDDATLKEVGAWPWRRNVLAEINEEIRAAGAKVIAYDVLFPEPQPGLDEQFAASIGQAGNVLLPISIQPHPQKSEPLLDAMVSAFKKDLELDEASLTDRLRANWMHHANLTADVATRFERAREIAAFDRTLELMNQGISNFASIETRLTPHARDEDRRTDASVDLRNALPPAESIHEVLTRLAPISAGLPPLLSTDDDPENVSAPVLTKASRYSASPLFLRDRDGVVRRVPLFFKYRDRIIPHTALATTCALLDVDIRNIHIQSDAVILPLPSGKDIRIPVYTQTTKDYGDVGLFMDVPWFGGNEWENIYDFPNHERAQQHLKLRLVWTIRQNIHDIERNNEKADDALKAASETYDMDLAKAFLKKSVDQRAEPDRWAAVADSLGQLKSMMPAEMDTLATKDLNSDEQQLRADYMALKQLKLRNDQFVAEVAERRAALKKLLQGRAVLIGWTAEGRIDSYVTPLQPQCPGVAVQGVILNGIVTGDLWQRAAWVAVPATLTMGLLVTLAVSRLTPKRALLVTLLLIAAYIVIDAVVMFAWQHWILSAAGPLIVAVACWTSLTLMRYLSERAESARIEGRFRSYVDPELVRYVKEHPDSIHIEGELKEMTVVFTDLRGFTSLSERLKERTVPILNEYMNRMLPIIRENRGYWNKFLGDGIMFFYNAPVENPNHARDAVATVLQMQKAMSSFNRYLRERDLPVVAMGAGISTGRMVVGDAGATSGLHRASDYTVLGDEVNLGARLESANKPLGSSILMTQRTRELCGQEFLLRPMGKLRVVGKTQSIMTYEPICLRSEASDDQLRLVEASESMIDCFRRSQFDACLKCIDSLGQHAGTEKVAALYARLCRQYQHVAPEEAFDGELVFSEK